MKNKNFKVNKEDIEEFVKRKSKQELEIEQLKIQIAGLIGDNLALKSKLFDLEKLSEEKC